MQAYLHSGENDQSGQIAPGFICALAGAQPLQEQYSYCENA